MVGARERGGGGHGDRKNGMQIILRYAQAKVVCETTDKKRRGGGVCWGGGGTNMQAMGRDQKTWGNENNPWQQIESKEIEEKK